MTAQIIDGKLIAADIRSELAEEITTLTADGNRAPSLAVILVGHDPASQIYVRNKERACAETGIRSVKYDLPTTTQDVLIELIHQLNADDEIDGILVQLPLPRGIDTDTVLDEISPEKDVDGFHPTNIGKLLQRRPGLRPCTPYGVMKMLDHYDIECEGRRAVVVGASNIVGRPMALELLLENATVTICNSKTRDLKAEVSHADIVVVGVGRPELVKGDWIKPGAAVIDVGMNRLPDGRLVGDVEFEPASHRAAWITPVPGGVGPMTIAMLLLNTMMAYHQRRAAKAV